MWIVELDQLSIQMSSWCLNAIVFFVDITNIK